MFDNKSYVKFEYNHDTDSIFIEVNVETGVDINKVTKDMADLLYSINEGILIEDIAKAILSYGKQNEISEITSDIIIKWKDSLSSDSNKIPFINPLRVFDYKQGEKFNA
tara:strand:- start:6645 stop:6971 length:327 start_codon:yes stop_codon:yes gene_type:complete